MKYKKYILAILLLISILSLSLSSCSGNEETNLRYNIEISPKNLDPQTAKMEEESMIVENTMEGLMSIDENGDIALGLADSYIISEDKLTYTFTLKENLKWVDSKNEEISDITSKDFLFSFERIFSLENTDDYFELFIIKNSKSFANIEDFPLGIETPNNSTIIFHLEEENANFLRLLSSHHTFPCNKEFFLETDGQYGLNHENLLYSGAFLLNYWVNNDYLLLQKNTNYYDSDKVLTSKIVIPIITVKSSDDTDEASGLSKETTLKEEFLKDRNDLLAISGEEIKDFDIDKIVYTKEIDSTWILIFNTQNDVFKNKNIRDGFKHSFKFDVDETNLPIWMTHAKNIIPMDTKLDGYEKYSKYFLDEITNVYDKELSHTYFNQGLQELELESLPKIEVVYQSDDFYTSLMQQMQSKIQENLSLFINIHPYEKKDLTKLYLNNDFDIIFYNLKGNINSPYEILNDISHYYDNAEYQNLIEQANLEKEPSIAFKYYYEAEKMLVDDSIVFPILQQSSFKISQENLKNINYSPSSGAILFKYAYKEK